MATLRQIRSVVGRWAVATRAWLGCLLLIAAPLQAAPMEISIPGPPFTGYRYFHQLLKEALEANGQEVVWHVMEDVPQARVLALLENGLVTIFWAVQTKERDQRYVRVGNRLTNGLIGARVAFVRKGQEEMFSRIRTLDDLRNSGAVACFGQVWFDVDVWRTNELPAYTQPGDWKVLYRMLASGQRGIDYFPRSVIEILDESAAQPDLSIEPHLMLLYDRDMYFYLSKNAESLRPIIEDALAKADASGLKARLIDKHFGMINRRLNIEKRTVIRLKSPEFQ